MSEKLACPYLAREFFGLMVRPEGVEPPTYWFVASCSIQLSYGRTLRLDATL